MKKLLAFGFLLLAWPAWGADNFLISQPNGANAIISATDSGGGILVPNVSCPTCTPTSGIVVGTTTITGGTTTRILYDNAGVVGEYTLTGTGTVVVMATSPTLVTPALGVATGTSLALGGATLGSNALAVTGTALFNSNSTFGTNTLLGGNASVFTSGGSFVSWNGAIIGWNSGATVSLATTAFDTNFSRNAAGVLQVGTTSANASGNLLANAIGLGGATIGSNALAVTGSIVNSGGVTLTSSSFNINGSTGFVSIFNTSLYGWASGGSVPGTIDTNISRNAAGVVQFGTTAANALGAWLAAKGTLTGGTLADQAQVLSVTATQPASPTGTQDAVIWTITSAGSASQVNRAFRLNYSAGYSGSSPVDAFFMDNLTASTASTLTPASGTNFSSGNHAIVGLSEGTTAGLNVGVEGQAQGGNVNVAINGLAQAAKTGAGTKTNIGVVGSAYNAVTGGSTPVHIGGFFSLNQTTVPTVSAALIADNGAQTDAIFLGRHAGSTVFSIGSSGSVAVSGTVTSQSYFEAGAAQFFLFTGRSEISSPADGLLLFRNTSETDFSRLQFGGTTSSFPALKRSTTILQARLADDSAYAPIEALTVRAGGFTVATLPVAGTAGRTAYVTDQLTVCAAAGAALTGGGAVVCPVFDNGVAWVGG